MSSVGTTGNSWLVYSQVGVPGFGQILDILRVGAGTSMKLIRDLERQLASSSFHPDCI